jgi:hypothetical protein
LQPLTPGGFSGVDVVGGWRKGYTRFRGVITSPVRLPKDVVPKYGLLAMLDTDQPDYYTTISAALREGLRQHRTVMAT